MKQLVFTFVICAALACNNDDRTPFLEEVEADLALLTVDTGGNQEAVLRQSSGADYDYFMYEPSGYATDNTAYPLMIYLHGIDAFGSESDLDKILNDGPPMMIEQGDWNPKFPVLVASPHLLVSDLDWEPNKIQAFIEHLESTYSINPSRIYITGISIGGIGIFEYLRNLGSKSKVAAVVPIAGAGAERLVDTIEDVPIWAFHGEEDRVISFRRGSKLIVEAINATNPETRALITTYPEAGHDVWTRTYDGTGMGQENIELDRFQSSVFDWMLSKKKE